MMSCSIPGEIDKIILTDQSLGEMPTSQEELRIGNEFTNCGEVVVRHNYYYNLVNCLSTHKITTFRKKVLLLSLCLRRWEKSHAFKTSITLKISAVSNIVTITNSLIRCVLHFKKFRQSTRNPFPQCQYYYCYISVNFVLNFWIIIEVELSNYRRTLFCFDGGGSLARSVAGSLIFSEMCETAELPAFFRLLILTILLTSRLNLTA